MNIPDPYWKIKRISAVLFLAVIISVSAYFITESFISLSQSQPIQKSSQEASVGKDQTVEQRVADIIKTGNFGLCQEIKDQTFRTVCTNNIALNLAKEKKDVSYCQKLDNHLVPIADCEQEVIHDKALEEENISICGQASDESVRNLCRENFYLELSLIKNDINICNQIQKEDQSEYCYNSYLVNKKFRSNIKGFDCLQLEGNDVRAECKKMQDLIGTTNTMQKFPDNELCFQFKTSLFNDYCLSLL